MEKYFDEIVKSTVGIIKFDSSLKEAQEGYPFGKEAGECLEYFLDLANSMGFETHNYDNYVGEVVFGEGKEFRADLEGAIYALREKIEKDTCRLPQV